MKKNIQSYYYKEITNPKTRKYSTIYHNRSIYWLAFTHIIIQFYQVLLLQMGAQIGSLRDPDLLIQRYLPHLSFSMTLGDYKLVKTALCSSQDEGQIVCKFFVDNLQEQDPMVERNMARMREIFDLRKHPNILVTSLGSIIDGQYKLYVAYRQFVYFSLLEKMKNKIPKMTMIEKKWIVFQLLCAVSQIHKESFVHGDLKPENVLITSFNQVYVTDMTEDITNYNDRFGNLDNNQRCYMAPERFIGDGYNESLKSYDRLEKSMDIFSAGCIIAEILMESNLFELATLKNYKRGIFNPRVILEKQLEDIKLVQLILKMIDLDPSKRPSVEECLQLFDSTGCMPQSFSCCFYQLSSSFVRPQYLFSDMRISLLRKFMPSIWRSCFQKDIDNQTILSKFKEPIERSIFDKLTEDGIVEHNFVLIPTCNLFKFLEPLNEEAEQIKCESKESAIIVVNWIGVFMPTCFYPQTRRCALEMLLQIAKACSLEIRLQNILPYVFTMFDDKQPKVQAKAVEVAVLMFESLIHSHEHCTLQTTDYKVFDNYIMPQFQKLQKNYKDVLMVQITYARYLPLLAKIGHSFTELSVTSRLNNKGKRGQDERLQPSGSIIEPGRLARPIESTISVVNPGPSVDLEPYNDSVLDGNQTLVLQNKDSTEEVNREPDFGSNNQSLGEAQQLASVRVQKFENEQEGLKVNYDQDIDSLRKMFVAIISDYAVRQEPSIDRLLYSRLGSLCDFFGSKGTMDNIIPLLSTCSNRKDFLVKLDCLNSLVGVGIKVGKQSLAQYMLLIYIQFLYDSEEVIVLEIIRTLKNLLRLNLISKETLLDDYKAKNINIINHGLLEKLLPFLVHPNIWIREETLNFVVVLCDHKHTKLLSKAEVYCMVRNKLKPYLQDASQVTQFLLAERTADQLINLLRVPLSRNTFEMLVKTDFRNYEDQQELKLSYSDKFAMEKLKFIIDCSHNHYQSAAQQKSSSNQKEPHAFWKNCIQYNLFRLMKINTIEKMGQDRNNQDGFSEHAQQQTKPKEQNTIVKKYTESYLNDYLKPCHRLKAAQAEDRNQGLNMIQDPQWRKLGEIDRVMQSLYLMPDDPSISLIRYNVDNFFTRIANQSLPANWRLQIEKVSTMAPQPTEIPQFHRGYSRTTSILVDEQDQVQRIRDRNQMGTLRKATESFRPKGQLVNTLYEHRKPVTSVAVTDDQSMFITASKDDGMVHVWNSAEVVRDLTARSRFSIACDRKVNQICTLQNSDYFCVAGSDNKVEVVEMARLGQGTSFKTQNRGIIEKNVGMPSPGLPTHSSVVQTLQHKNEGDIMNCLSTVLPVSHQHMLVYSSQKGSLFMHDLRARSTALQQQGAFALQRGMVTCMTLGQDPYQILCGTIGGYMMVYDIRFNFVSTCFKHSQKYPITSISAFKPQDRVVYPQDPLGLNITKTYNRSTHKSPLVLIGSGGPNFEMSMLNLETGNIEILMTVNEAEQAKDNTAADAANGGTGLQIPSYLRESFIRDGYSEPEKSETNQSKYKRYLMQTKSLVSTQQIKMTQNLDDELFKASKARYRLLMQASESSNACRKILVPRKSSSLLQGTLTTDYAITGGNDKKLRYWSLPDPAQNSFYINTPLNDECQYFSSHVAGGTVYVREQVSRVRNFPRVNANMIQAQMNAPKQPTNKLTIGGTEIELAGDSIYYQVVQNMLSMHNSEADNFQDMWKARNHLTQSPIQEISQGSAHQFQLDMGREKVVVYNYNGLSEWQHFNGISMNEGNATQVNNSLNDKYGSSSTSSKQSSKQSKKDQLKDPYKIQGMRSTGVAYNQNTDMADEVDLHRDYLYRESRNISHSDAILDLAVLEVSGLDPVSFSQMEQSPLIPGLNQSNAYYYQNDFMAAMQTVPILISCSRDGTVKLWR